MSLLLRLLFHLLGRLPLAWLQGLGARSGAWWWRRGRREARTAAVNLGICFPSMDGAQAAALARRTLEETGRTALELPWLWTRPAARLARAIRVVEGEQLFREALVARSGLIIAAPHLGAWEALNLYLSAQTPIAILYRPPRQRWLEDALNRWRGRLGAEPVPAEAAGVRRLLRRLKEGGVVGILPDQQPRAGEGEFAEFFGRPALTMTLLPKLAARSGAQVLFAWAERLPAAAGYAIRFSDEGPITDTGALNRALERLVRQCPQQYQWTYRRFGLRPEGYANPYREGGDGG